MQHNKEFFMELALENAKKAFRKGEVPIGAVCVYDDEVIAEGYNQVISKKDPTAHAELIALRSACRKIGNYRLKDAQFYVTVEPCPMCISALLHARIGLLVFGAISEKWGYMSRFQMDLSLWNYNLKVFSGILSKDSEKMLKDFFIDKRV